MTEGHIIRRDKPKEAPQIIAFDSYAVDLDRFEQAGRDGRAEAARALLPGARQPAAQRPGFRQAARPFRAELHERLSNPLYPIAFVLIVLAFVGQAQSNRQNRWKGVTAAIVLAICDPRVRAWCQQSGGAERQVGAPALRYSDDAVVLSMVLIWRNARPTPGLGLGERVGFAVSDALARLKPARRRAQERDRATSTREGRVISAAMLRRYIARNSWSRILGTFALCAVLIFMIDFVEMLRQSRQVRQRICLPRLLWMTLLRLPAYTEILLAFAVLVGSIGALLMLNRKSELTVMRAGGMSVWQFLRPGLTVVACCSASSRSLVYNPLAAAARAEAERLFAEAFGREVEPAAPSERRHLAAAGRRRRAIGDERRRRRRPGPDA